MFWKTGRGCNAVLARSLSHVYYHPLCLSFSLSLAFAHIHTHATHCKICLWCLAALSLESLHNTLESTHQTFVLWVWVDHSSVLFDHQRGSSVQAYTFYAVGKLCHTTACQYATTKADSIWKSWTCMFMCVRMSIQIGHPSETFGAGICSCIKNPMVP